MGPSHMQRRGVREDSFKRETNVCCTEGSDGPSSEERENGNSFDKTKYIFFFQFNFKEFIQKENKEDQEKKGNFLMLLMSFLFLWVVEKDMPHTYHRLLQPH